MSHTPGPWILQGFRIYGPPDERSKHGNGRSLIGGVVDDGIDWRSAPLDPGGRGAFYEEAIANARLMVAAPELLRAARSMLAAHGAEDTAQYDAGLDACRAAISMAEGKEEP